MTVKETIGPISTVELFMAGDFREALMTIRDDTTETSYCVTVAPCEYVYKYGQESGFVVGFRIHPRYADSIPDRLEILAGSLARKLMLQLNQRTATITTPTRTILLEREEK